MCEITEDTAIAMCQSGLKGLEALDFTFTPVTPKALVQFNSMFISFSIYFFLLICRHVKFPSLWGSLPHLDVKIVPFA